MQRAQVRLLKYSCFCKLARGPYVAGFVTRSPAILGSVLGP